MKKYRFLKNLYQIISFSCVLLVFVIILAMAFVASLSYENSNGWYLLLFAGITSVIFFIVGLYWIFQIVVIDEIGIRIILFTKTIRTVSWDNILEIKRTSVMRNPAYVLVIKNENNLNLDDRKSIRKAICQYVPEFMNG